MVRERFLPVAAPTIGQDAIDEALASFRSGWIGPGPKVHQFERMLEAYTGARHARCLASGSDALFLALRCLDIGAGDEVIVPTMTFVASANAVEHAGAKPILIDCAPGSGLIDLSLVEAAITPRTRALMVVHFAGRPVDLAWVQRISTKHGVAVIEDAAHAIGAEIDGSPIGASGNPTALSFHATKNITTIDGGALLTNDPQLADRGARLARQGLVSDGWSRYSESAPPDAERDVAVEPGFRMTMNDIQAAIGMHQLPNLDNWIARRAHQAAVYDSELAGLPISIDEPPPSGVRHAHHLYQITLRKDAPIDRNELAERLRERGIGSGIHYRAVHLHPYYRDRYDLKADAFPVASARSACALSLPLGPAMTELDQADVVKAVTQLLGH